MDTLFSDSFSTPTNTNWIVEAPWDIGPGVEFVGDPTYDTTPSLDNGLAGTVIGGAYGNSVNSSLISKRLNTRGWEGLKLQFNSWEHFEPNKDFGRVLVSTNDGASWTEVFSTSARDTKWVPREFDISDFRSDLFKLRFQLLSDPYSPYPPHGGWSLDDIRILGKRCQVERASCDGTSPCCGGLSCVDGFCTPQWSNACIDKVGDVCGSRCPETGSCEHSLCLAGGPLTNGCDSCVQAICDMDPSCCMSAWSNRCVAKVGPVCSINCSEPAGQCQQYSPGEVNPYCVGVPDLTAGVPCEDVVPICNRGDVQVEKDTASFFFLPDIDATNDFSKCSAGAYFPDNAVRCPIPVEIPPGECRSIECEGMVGNGAVVVNPPADARIVDNFPGYSPIPECSCQNNWSLYKSDPTAPECNRPVCSSNSVEARIPTVNMYIMFDKSGSMGTGSRWAQTTGALRAFIRDPSSAGLRVGFRFFPRGTYVYDCRDENFRDPDVEIGDLRAETSMGATCDGVATTDCGSVADTQECLLIQEICGTTPSGATPLLSALGGALMHMEQMAKSKPMDRNVVVLVTDGEPTDCHTQREAFYEKAADAYSTYGVVTYMVNVADGNKNLMQEIANRGHGEYFYITDANAATELSNALNQIRANSVSCDLLLNASVEIDPNDVSVSFQSSGGAASSFSAVVDADACGSLTDAFYFDESVGPTKITLCPDTCSLVRADVGSRTDLVVSCHQENLEETFPFIYTASCPPGSAIRWGQLTWNTSTPGNSSVVFGARTTDNILDFDTPSEELDLLGTAHGNVAPFVDDNQVCTMFGPTPACPVEIANALGAVPASRRHLELSISLMPTVSGKVRTPKVTDWNITYSCPNSE